MVDKVFLRLNNRWALGYDELQWMIMRRHRRKGVAGWQSVAFISDQKAVVLRILREKGIEVSPGATCALAQLPARFRDWFPSRQEWIAEHAPSSMVMAARWTGT